MAPRLEVVRVVHEKCPQEWFFKRFELAKALPLLGSLNRARNEGLAHKGTLNQKRAEALIDELEPQLEEVLRCLSEGVAHFELVRDCGKSAKRGCWCLESFKGPHSTRTLINRPLSEDVIKTMALFHRDEVLALWPGQVFSLSPFILWKQGDGHCSELAFFKKEDGQRCEYEMFDDASEHHSSEPKLQTELDVLRKLVVSSKGNT